MKHFLDNEGEVVGNNVVVDIGTLTDVDHILTMVADTDTTIKSKILNSLLGL